MPEFLHNAPNVHDEETGALVGYINPKTNNPEPFSAGGGSSTFAGLTDKATANLPSINAPLAAALGAKAPLSSPAFTDTPTAPTAAPGTSTTQIATTAFVAAAVAGAASAYPEVLNFAALPGAPAEGDTYVVLQAQGVYFINRKPAGLYRYASGSWVYLGEVPDGYFTDNTLSFFDNADPTKQLAFELSGIATGQTRTLTAPDASGTIALTSDTRFTDSREWTAATVGQTEAEAGTATTRVAWTAQRVAQAIAAQVAAWWAALTVGPSKITMATGKLLGRSTAGSGGAEEIAIGAGLTLSAGTLSASGGGGSPGGSSGQVQYNNAGAFGGAANVSVVSTGGGTSNCLAVGDSGANPGFVSVRGSPSSNGPHGLRFWSATDAVAVVGYDQGTTRKAGIGFLDFGQTTLRMAVTCTNGDLKTEFGGPVYPKQYTTATRPAWVNGAVIFDTDIDKLVIGGASAWEAVTSA